MSDETIIELARMLAEERRARKLAEAAAMAPPMEQPIGDGVAACRYKSLAEQRGDALETAQVQIAELRAKLAAAYEHDAAEVARLRALLREAENERDYLREQRDRGRS